MRRVAVVLDILPARRIGETVLVLGRELAHDSGEGLFAVRLCGGGSQGAQDGAGDEVRGGGGGAGDQRGRCVERDDRVAVAAQHALDRGRAVEARGHGAAEGFDAGDCFGRGARDDDVDGRGEEFWVLYTRLIYQNTAVL